MSTMRSVFGPARDVETAGGTAVDQQEIERRAGVVLLVVAVLRLELLAQERHLLFRRPGHDRQLLLPRARVEVEQERPCPVADRP